MADVRVPRGPRYFLDGELPFEEQAGRYVHSHRDEVLGDGDSRSLVKETIRVALAHADLRGHIAYRDGAGVIIVQVGLHTVDRRSPGAPNALRSKACPDRLVEGGPAPPQ